MTLEINPFQYARETNAANPKGYGTHLIPNGWCRSPLIFSNMLVLTIHSQQQQTRQASYISKCSPTLTYIKSSSISKYNYMHGQNIHSYTHVKDEK